MTRTPFEISAPSTTKVTRKSNRHPSYMLQDLPARVENGGAEAEPLTIRQSLTVTFGRPGVKATVVHKTDPQTGVVMISKYVVGMNWDDVRLGSLEDLALEYLEMAVGLIVSDAPFRLTSTEATRISEEVAVMLREGRVPDPTVFTSMAFDHDADYVRIAAIRDTFGIDMAA